MSQSALQSGYSLRCGSSRKLLWLRGSSPLALEWNPVLAVEVLVGEVLRVSCLRLLVPHPHQQLQLTL